MELIEKRKWKKFNKEGITIRELKDLYNKASKIYCSLLEETINEMLIRIAEKRFEYLQIKISRDYNVIYNYHKQVAFLLPNDPSADLSYYAHRFEDVFLDPEELMWNQEKYPITYKNYNPLHLLSNRTMYIRYKNILSSFSLKNGITNLSVNIKYNQQEDKYIIENKDDFKYNCDLEILALKDLQDEKVTLFFKDWKLYNELNKCVNDHMYLLLNRNLVDTNLIGKNKIIIDNNRFIYNDKIHNEFYKDNVISYYDLSKINFDNLNISRLNISKNPEVKINFDKIVKDLTDSNINGYNLKKYTFRNFNLTNTDLRNTGATIDLGSCVISCEGKIASGTLFDEDNKFLFGNKQLDDDTIKKLGVKIYRKEN